MRAELTCEMFTLTAAGDAATMAKARGSINVCDIHRSKFMRIHRDSACTEAQAALLRAAGGGGPPIDPRRTLDGGLGLPAEDDE